MNMSKREKVLVSVVMVLAVFCMYYLIFFKPNMDEMHTVNADIEEKTLECSNVQQQQQIINSMNKAISGNEAKIAELSKSITTGFDQPAALVYLEQTVNQYATKVGFVFTSNEQIGQLDACSVSITMASSYDGIKKLLAAFADSPYFIKVVSLQAAVDSEQQQAAANTAGTDSATPATTSLVSSDGKLSVVMGIEIYAQPGEPSGDTPHEFADGYQYGGDIFN